ncbi:hypothetical protein [Mycobacterium sp. 1081908.1]|uniref:hypothetical protein n=1 Tax=Mycobacterium sp. 1081908.1 TaxID=1834066 RepID=UPI0012EA0496|nr:hypothetical protein [Mycobacterium sp. 1081908.1]
MPATETGRRLRARRARGEFGIPLGVVGRERALGGVRVLVRIEVAAGGEALVRVAPVFGPRLGDLRLFGVAVVARVGGGVCVVVEVFVAG